MHTGKILTQDEIETKIREALKQIRGKYLAEMEDARDCSFDVWEGVPYVEIVKYARENHADLIVMAQHTRKIDREDTSLGVNIEQVIVRAGCPVICIDK